MFRFPLLIAVLLATGIALRAQAPTDADLDHTRPAETDKLIQEWLPNGSPVQQAWAAYWIGRDHRYQEIPRPLDLVSTFQARSETGSSSGTDNDLLLAAVLDALIQLHGDVPKANAEALYPKFPVQALVLLSRTSDDARDVVSKIMDSATQRITWLAAADLLAADPPAGFTARLLKGIAIRMTIQLLSAGQSGIGWGEGGSCGEGSNSGRGGWPPAGLYYLSLHDSPTSALLADGENPVYVRRVDPGQDAPGSCAEDMFLDIAGLRRDLVGQLLGLKKEQFALQLNPSLDVTWSTGQAYVDTADDSVRKPQDTLQQTVAALEAQGLLTEAEAESNRPSLEVAVLDLRREKTPLPSLSLTDPSITVTYQAQDLP
jgi:hypothetical protein